MTAYLVDDSFKEEHRRIVRKVDGMRGDGVANSPNGVTVKHPASTPPPQTVNYVPGMCYDARRSGAAVAITGAVRWKYPIVLGYYDGTTNPSTGGTWVPTTTGITIYAFNSTEALNTSTGSSVTIGTGNNANGSTGAINEGSCELLSIPDGGDVVVKFRYLGSDGNLYFTIINFANSAED